MSQIVEELAPNFSGFFAGTSNFVDQEEMKLLLSVEICRHGEKIPHNRKVLDLTVDPSKNFSKQKNANGITDTGHKSQYVNG